MLYDSVDRLALYGSGPLWSKICEVLTAATAAHPEGEFPIAGEDAFYRVMRYATKPREQCRIESHRRYVDIQFSLEGAESIAVFRENGLAPDGPYDTGNDVQFYRAGAARPLATAFNFPGYCTLLLPHDLHRPQESVQGEPLFVKKAVIKVKYAAVFSSLRNKYEL